MRLIPVGLGVVTGLQIVAAATAYPILTLGVGLAVSVYGTLVSPDQGARTVFFIAGLPMAFGALLMAAVFAVVLYRYAAYQTALGPFRADELQAAVRSK